MIPGSVNLCGLLKVSFCSLLNPDVEEVILLQTIKILQI